MYMFETLLEWSAGWDWAEEGCKRVRSKVLSTGAEAMKVFIRHNKLNGLRLLVDTGGHDVGRPPKWRVSLGLQVTWLTIRVALETRASQRLIHTLLCASSSDR